MSETFTDAFDLLSKIQGSKSPNTSAQCEQILAHLRPWFGRRSLAKFETDFEELWSEFVAYSRENHKGRKLSHDRRYLVQALGRAERKGWIKRHFSKTDFALLESTEKIGKYIPAEDVKKLLDYLFKHSSRTWLQVQMAHSQGMRMSEILKLRKEEIDWRKMEINLDPKRLKTRRARQTPIPITKVVGDALASYCQYLDSDYVFPSVSGPNDAVINLKKPQSDNSYWWRKARKATGVKCRFHDLRHTCVSNALARGMPIGVASKIFGATPQVLNSIYDHLRPGDRELHRNILDGIS